MFERIVVAIDGSREGGKTVPMALDLAARAFLDPGDRVLLESPSYLAAIQTFDSYEAEYETLPVDDHDNAVQCGTCVLLDSDNNIIISEQPGHLISTIGLSDSIIITVRDNSSRC